MIINVAICAMIHIYLLICSLVFLNIRIHLLIRKGAIISVTIPFIGEILPFPMHEIVWLEQLSHCTKLIPICWTIYSKIKNIPMNTIMLKMNSRNPILLSHLLLCIREIINPPPEMRERNMPPNIKLMLLWNIVTPMSIAIAGRTIPLLMRLLIIVFFLFLNQAMSVYSILRNAGIMINIPANTQRSVEKGSHHVI